MKHLMFCMHPSIGATRTHGGHMALIDEPAQGRLQDVLNGLTAGLALPALKRLPVVADAQSDAQTGSAQIGQEQLGASFEQAGGVGLHLFGQGLGRHAVAQGQKLFGQLELGEQGF